MRLDDAVEAGNVRRLEPHIGQEPEPAYRIEKDLRLECLNPSNRTTWLFVLAPRANTMRGQVVVLGGLRRLKRSSIIFAPTNLAGKSANPCRCTRASAAVVALQTPPAILDLRPWSGRVSGCGCVRTGN